MRKRSKYRPKHLPGTFTLPINIRHSAKDELAMQLVPHSELEKLRDGTADDYVWNTLAFRLNFGYVLANEFGEEARAHMVSSLDAVRAVKARHEKTSKWGATGDEFFALGDGLNLTDEMQKATTRAQQLAAARITMTVNEYKVSLQ